MSESLRYQRFDNGAVVTALATTPPTAEMIDAWAALRRPMRRTLPPEFTRNEWAYLMTFVGSSNLWAEMERTFGRRVDADTAAPAGRLARPRGDIAIWLPANISLLGPLTLVLLSLTGNRIRAKGPSGGNDLVGPWLDFVVEHASEVLADHVRDHVEYEIFDRTDPRNAEMAAAASLKVVFGSDEAGEAISGLPHPLGSSELLFVDRRSEAWLEPDAIDDEVVDLLIRVFGIYGQAGCTSPGRVVVLDATYDPSVLRDRIAERWDSVMTSMTEMHTASENRMSYQLARINGLDPLLLSRAAAVVASGPVDSAPTEGHMFLPIHAADLDEAIRTLPPNIQTIGLAVRDPHAGTWLDVAAGTGAVRIVELGRMHHFGGTWDGYDVLKEAVRFVELPR